MLADGLLEFAAGVNVILEQKIVSCTCNILCASEIPRVSAAIGTSSSKGSGKACPRLTRTGANLDRSCAAISE